jgi:hypothetical protein
MYHYWCFGITIESELQFPEFITSNNDSADVTISFGEVPLQLTGEKVSKYPDVSISPSEFLLTVKSVGKYYAKDGNTIIVDPEPGVDTSSLRLFLLSNVMAAILYQQQKIPFHASGIIVNEELVLFTGPSGIGKSTTLLGLIEKGYDLFTDDVCVLSENENTGKIEAVASYPMMKLWKNTIDHFRLENSFNHQLRPSVQKYGIFKHQQFKRKAYPVTKLFILSTTDENTLEFSVNRLNNIESFKVLQENAYRRSYIELMDLKSVHFTMMSKLVGQCDVLEVKRSVNGKIASFIESITLLL